MLESLNDDENVEKIMISIGNVGINNNTEDDYGLVFREIVNMNERSVKN